MKHDFFLSNESDFYQAINDSYEIVEYSEIHESVLNIVQVCVNNIRHFFPALSTDLTVVFINDIEKDSVGYYINGSFSSGAILCIDIPFIQSHVDNDMDFEREVCITLYNLFACSIFDYDENMCNGKNVESLPTDMGNYAEYFAQEFRDYRTIPQEFRKIEEICKKDLE